MDGWLHSACDGCWWKHNPAKVPLRFKLSERQMEVCCYCGDRNLSGIYFRADPDEVRCHGEHVEP